MFARLKVAAIVAGVAAAALLAGFAYSGGPAEPMTTLQTNAPAPDFTGISGWLNVSVAPATS